MDLRHLRYFIAVAEELSFTRAAERLRIAQPPLSQQIRHLETELGVSLLYRTRRHVELTDSGRLYLDHARHILRLVEAAKIQVQRAQRGEIGQLAVGFFEHVSYTLLPPVLRAYRERYPEIAVQLRWFPVVDQVNALLRGDVDISFLRPVFDAEDIVSEVLLKEPFVLAVPSDHAFAALDTVALRDCASENLILYSQLFAPDFHRMILGMCAAAGFAPKVVAEVAQVYTALGLVSSGAGLAFVPAAVRRVRFEHVAYKTLSGGDAQIEILLGWTQRTPSPPLKAFIETAKIVLRDMHGPGT